MMSMNHVLRPFEENINPGDTKALKLYLQATKKIDKETDMIYISVSNTKYIVYHFLSLDNKYIWVRLEFMVNNGAGPKKMSIVVERIIFEEI